jgi:hypothetical protein
MVAATGFLVAGHHGALAQRLVQATPTNIAGVAVVAPPPATFDLNSATDADLASHAIPPRPSSVTASKAFAKWQAAMGGLQTRETPEVRQTTISHGPARGTGGFKAVPETDATVTGSSGNWSGTSTVNGTFSTVEAIIGEFTVPIAQQAFGTCTGGWDYSSFWPGIDGNGSNDVLQGGIEADAYCSNGSKATYYSPWIEWYPNYSADVSSPAVAPGDLVFVEVWSASPTLGYVYFYNYSTNVSAEYQLTAPSGTTLKGNSVEWIVERPSVGGSLANLTNYVNAAWPYGVAWNYQAASPTYYFQGENPSVGTLEVLTMLDNNGQGISSPTLENTNFLWFQNYGSSCGLASSPPC